MFKPETNPYLNSKNKQTGSSLFKEDGHKRLLIEVKKHKDTRTTANNSKMLQS